MLLLLVLLIHTPFTHSITTESKDGDILIGFIGCRGDDNTPNQLEQNLLSFLNATTDTSLWPDNVYIGYVLVVYDEDEQPDLKLLMNLLNDYPKIVAIVGVPMESLASRIVSFVTSIKLPVYSNAIGMLLDDIIDEERSSPEYLTRITSHMTIEVHHTLLQILEQLGINIVTLIHSKSKVREYTELGNIFEFAAEEIEVEHTCEFFGEMADHSCDADTDRTLFNNSYFGADDEINRLQTVLLLLNTGDIMEFVTYLQANGAKNLLLVVGTSGCSLYLDNDEYASLRANNVSLIKLCQTSYQDQNLIDYIQNFEAVTFTESGEEELPRPSDIIYDWYVDMMGSDCVVQNSPCPSAGETILPVDLSQSYSRSNHRIYYSVLKIMKALEGITDEEVKVIKARTYLDVLEASTVGEKIHDSFLENNVELPEGTAFLRFKDGSMSNDFEVIYSSIHEVSAKVDWHENDTASFGDAFAHVKSHIISDFGMRLACSATCSPGTRTVPDSRLESCWTCQACTGNTYSSSGEWTLCRSCNSTIKYPLFPYYANPARTACTTSPSRLTIRTVEGKLVYSLAVFNICILLFTVGVYIKHCTSRVIISSGRDLSTIMFVGILVGHIEAMLIATSPSPALCCSIQVLAHVFMMLTVCPLIVKTFRIFLIFKFSTKLGKTIKRYVNIKVVMAECAVLAFPQLFFLLLGLFVNDDFKFNLKINQESLDPNIKVSISCSPKSYIIMFISMTYTGIILLLSTLLGWSCRKLPNNYKESMHIFLSSLISLLLVTAYVPAMIQLAGFMQIFSLAMILTIISLALNVIIFFPRLYAVLFMSAAEQNVNFNSTKKTLESTQSSSVKVVINQSVV